MFFHGIPFIHLIRQYPVLDPARQTSRKSRSQRADARRLIRRIGFEPVHLLRSSPEYPVRTCLEECFRYGDTVFAFPDLPYPRVQLSRNEWGVKALSLNRACWVFTTRRAGQTWLRQHFPQLPLFLCGDRTRI